MGQSDNVIPSLGVLRGIVGEAASGVMGAQAAGAQQVSDKLSGRLTAAAQEELRKGLDGLFPPPRVDGVRDLSSLLDLMAKVARGDSEYGAVELSPQACRELLNLVDQGEAHRQAAEACSRLVDQARNERDGYLAKLSEVAKGRDGAYAKLDQAQGEITGLRAEVGELRFALESTRKENTLVNSLLESVVKERDEVQRKFAIASGLVDSASPIMLGLKKELDEARASLVDARVARDGLAAALGKAEARIDDLEAVAPDDSGDKEPPRHLHCCECEQCQPPQRGVVIINIFRAEGHCPVINVGGKGEG